MSGARNKLDQIESTKHIQKLGWGKWIGRAVDFEVKVVSEEKIMACGYNNI